MALVRSRKKSLIWSAGIFAALAVLAFFGLPPLAKSRLIKTLSVALHREVSIQHVTVNPFTLSLTIKGLLVKDRAVTDTFISIDELFVNLEGIPALRAALIAKEIRITRPFLRITRHQDNSYNFSDLFERSGTGEERPGPPFGYSLNNIQVINGSADFWDEPEQKRHLVRDVNISVPFISNHPQDIDIFVEPSVSATIDDTRYALVGKIKPLARSRETIFDIKIDNLDIAYYFSYVPIETNLRIPSGYIDAQLQVSFSEQESGQRALILKGDLAMKDVSIHDGHDNPILELPLLNISIASAEPFVKRFHLARISLQSPEVRIRRDSEGAINVASLLPSTQEPQKGPETESDAASISMDVDEIRVASGKISFSDLSRTSPSKTVSNPDDEQSVDVEDQSPREQVVLKAEDVDLSVANLSTKEGQSGSVSLSFRLNQKGRIVTKGSMALHPLSAQLAVDVKGIDIRPFQPYYADRVNIIVRNGSLSTSGNLSMIDRQGAGRQITYKGDARLSQFSSLDKAHSEDLLRWESLFLGGMSAGYNPNYVHIQAVALNDFFARLIIHPDGSLNLNQAFEGKPEQAKPLAATRPHASHTPSLTAGKGVQNIRVPKITLQGGRIDFSDRFVKPNYSVKLVEVGGRISGLSSEERTVADVELRGNLDQYAPLEITGKINPLRQDLFIDLKANFRNMDLSSMTPYSGKYIGYTVGKGKLAFDVSYQIVEKKLDAKNNVFFDQLTLGEKVESPTATNLPVRLAIALLKDRNGEIRLDIPVAGSLDDPKFSVWRIILQIIVNLLAKAATSPFALLGASFGGGEELGYLEFDDGSSALTERNIKKADTLIKALQERPSLKLEIEGHVDAEKDKEGLKQYFFNKRVKAQKLKDQLKQGVPAVPVDEIQVEPQEYEKYLRMAYRAEKFPKPRNILGFEKSVPVPEMEKLMLTNLVVTDDDMRSLASQRAIRTKDLILQSRKINPERVFIIEPKSLSPERSEKVKDGRVDLRIRV